MIPTGATSSFRLAISRVVFGVQLSRIMVAMLLLTLISLGFAQEEEAEAASDVTKLVFTLNEMNFILDGQQANTPIVLEIGKSYALEFENIGKIKHEVLWGRTPIKTATGALEDYETNLFASTSAVVDSKGWEIVNAGLIEVVLEPGQTMEVIVTIPEEMKGDWEMGCFQPGHYEAGMHAAIVIQ
jgi:uncharacterized cupredoxin-like copper-binding protein